MRETQRFHFYPIHQDYTDAGESIIVQLADGRLNKLLPGESLPVERRAFVGE
jgi:hypothetical protein